MFLKTHMCTYSFQKMVANCNEVDCVRVAICSTLVCCQLKKHLSSVLVSNGYPSSFVVKLAKTPRVTANIEPALGFKSTAVLPYIKDVSKVLRGFLQHQGIRTILKSYITLRSPTKRTNKTKRCRLQDPMRMQQSVYGWNREINAKKDKRTWQKHTVCLHSNVCGFGACVRNGAYSYLERR